MYRRPVLLVRKAQRLRKTTGDERYYAPLELKKMTFGKRLESILAKPFVLLIREPMLIAVTIYQSVSPSSCPPAYILLETPAELDQPIL